MNIKLLLSFCLIPLCAHAQGFVSTIANLRAASVSGLSSGYQESVAGYAAPGDGGAGIFIYMTASTLADNGGTVIQPTSGAGRWLRAFDGNEVNVEWFGAKGDGATNDQPSIQAAINAVSAAGGSVKLANKKYEIAAALKIQANHVSLRGAGQQLTILEVTGLSQDGVDCTSATPGQTIAMPALSGFKVQTQSSKTSSGAGVALINTSLAKIVDLHVDGFATGMLLQAATNSNVQRVECSCGTSTFDFVGFCLFGGTGSAFYPQASSMYRDCIVDASNNTGTSIGFKIYGNAIADIYLDQPGTLNCSYGISIDGSSASVPQGGNPVPYNWDIQIHTPVIDQFKVHGILISNNSTIGQIGISEGWTNPLGSTAGSGVYISSSRGVKIQGMQWNNIASVPNQKGCTVDSSSDVALIGNKSVNTRFGIYLLNSSATSVHACTVYNDANNAGGTGILCSGATDCSFTGNIVDGTNAVGFYTDSTGARNTFTANVCKGSVSTPYQFNGSHDFGDWSVRGQ